MGWIIVVSIYYAIIIGGVWLVTGFFSKKD
jgi:hypothetical protein